MSSGPKLTGLLRALDEPVTFLAYNGKTGRWKLSWSNSYPRRGTVVKLLKKRLIQRKKCNLYDGYCISAAGRATLAQIDAERGQG